MNEITRFFAKTNSYKYLPSQLLYKQHHDVGEKMDVLRINTGSG